MDRIVPYLWFDQEAGDAVDFYVGLFEDSGVLIEQNLEDTPSGENTVNYSFKLAGQHFGAINGGPFFKLNPSISLTILGKTANEIQKLWDKLAENGQILLPLQKYSFSEFYGWVEDKFGVSWHLISTEGNDYEQKIIPTLLFAGENIGKAKEAMHYYTEIFHNGEIVDEYDFEEGMAENPNAKLMHGLFKLMGVQLAAMDDMDQRDFDFNEAFSLMVMCETQGEIDYYWDKLTAVAQAEQCGWLKDKYGISWQIVPHNMDELLSKGTRKQINAVTEAFLKMKKLDKDRLEMVWQMNAE